MQELFYEILIFSFIVIIFFESLLCFLYSNFMKEKLHINNEPSKNYHSFKRTNPFWESIYRYDKHAAFSSNTLSTEEADTGKRAERQQ